MSCSYGSYCCVCVFVFVFKQKTAYEMRISDWSSDVCSSDLFEHRKNVVGDGLINVDPVRFLSHFPHSFRRSRCLRPAALTRWRSAGWGGGSKIDGSGAGGATREAPARASAPEQIGRAHV